MREWGGGELAETTLSEAARRSHRNLLRKANSLSIDGTCYLAWAETVAMKYVKNVIVI
ncbi:hypothetical protein M407DRAFT_26177 [Tulasnella calospora MUT 4182]|uniref:Uncharacterized protein n=1 Tax=Tulasnella calospora MUT 4182 TaxID=1051891 RepID=A0A0C3LSX4_9AGAM|nr:hypothetical protein M407DRAFT_26177 [Tulasnella calospora MUT 4182]